MEQQQDEQFDLNKMIEMSKTVAESIGCLDINLLCEYLDQYVLMLKTLGKLVEIGFSDVSTKAKILRENKEKLEAKGEDVSTIEKLMEKEVELGLGKVNGSNNGKHKIPKSSEWYKHTGSCRTTERVLRFLLFVEGIMLNMYNKRDESLAICIKNAYDKELAAHHNFFLRGAVKGIVYLLPDRDSFLNSLTKNTGPLSEEAKYSLMNDVIINSQTLTSYLKEFMGERDLLNLD